MLWCTERCFHGPNISLQARNEGWDWDEQERPTEEVWICIEQYNTCVSQISGMRTLSQCHCSYDFFWATHSGLTKATKWDDFFDFIRGTLIPHMGPFDGVSPHSILIMDNCSVHHVNKVRKLLQQAGFFMLFLPPNSPNLNPLEKAFSYI